MSLFGQNRDFKLMQHFNRELIGRIIEQKVGYYKIILEESPTNIYSEAVNKKFRDPVLMDCLIQRGNIENESSEIGVDVSRNTVFKFLKLDMIEANLYPETGDIIMWNENYYEIEVKNENQLFVGKDSDYSYDTSTDGFGGSLSIILTGHLTRPDALGLTQQRL